MNKDNHLLAEAYTKALLKEASQEWEVKRHEKEQSKWDRRKARWDQWKKETPEKAKEHAANKSREFGRSEDAESRSTEAEIEKLLNYLRQDYSSGKGLDNDTLGDVIHEIEDIIRSGNPEQGSEDAEENHCPYAAKGCDCDGCEECHDNDMKGEDAESTSIDVDTLIDAIKQNQIDKGNKEFANAHVIGALGFLIKRALQNPKSLQDDINRTYQSLTEKK